MTTRLHWPSSLIRAALEPVMLICPLMRGGPKARQHAGRRQRHGSLATKNQSPEWAAPFLSRLFRALSVFHPVALGWYDSHLRCSQAPALKVHYRLKEKVRRHFHSLEAMAPAAARTVYCSIAFSHQSKDLGNFASVSMASAHAGASPSLITRTRSHAPNSR